MDVEHKLIEEKVPFWLVTEKKMHKAECSGIVYGNSTGFIIKHGEKHLTIYEDESGAATVPANLKYSIGSKISGRLARVVKMEQKEGKHEIEGFLSSEYEFPPEFKMRVIANQDDAIMAMENLLVPKDEGHALVEVKQGELAITYRLKVSPDDVLPNRIPGVSETNSLKMSERLYAVSDLKVEAPEEQLQEVVGKLIRSRQDSFGGWHYVVEVEDEEREFWSNKVFPVLGMVKISYRHEPIGDRVMEMCNAY